MFKKIFTITLFIFCQTTITSETEFKFITIDDLPWVESRSGSEISNDSFFAEAESLFDPTDGEMLNEVNMMGNDDGK